MALKDFGFSFTHRGKPKSIHSGSWYLKLFDDVIFFILNYVLRAVNLVSQYSISYYLIFQKTIKWFNIPIFNIEENVLKLMLYKEFLTHYKNQNTVPKGF